MKRHFYFQKQEIANGTRYAWCVVRRTFKNRDAVRGVFITLTPLSADTRNRDSDIVTT